MTIFLIEVASGYTVANDYSLESPFVAENALEVACVAAARVAVDSLIGAHHLGYVPLLHQCLKSWEIGLPKVAFGEVLYIEGVTVPFRT